MVYTPFDILCFGVIPRELRAVSNGGVSCAWNTYLSFRTHE